MAVKLEKVSDVEARWNTEAKKLVGRKIVKAYYMSEEDAHEMMWNNRPIVLELDDGTALFPSSDDEGNDGGALIGGKDGSPVDFPVL